MKSLAISSAILIGVLCTAAPLAAAPRASISGNPQVGATLTVVVSGGKASGIRWEQCAVRVRANRCARVVRIGTGRRLVVPAASRGRSVRAVMRVRGTGLRTRFTRPIAAAATQLSIPAGWQVTGSQATIPFAAGTTQAQKDQTIAQLNVAYAAIAGQVRGGRVLFFAESLGNGGLITEITLNLCTAGTAFTRRVAQSGLGGDSTSSVSGTWAITLDLATGVAPTLVLTDAAGTQLRDAIDLVDASRVKLGANTYTTGPSTTCA